MRAEAEELAFSTRRPPSGRRSRTITARIWSKSNSRGTPPKTAKACSRPCISVRMS
jgi:hypothetical protein